jgi:uncharacterized membrane protein YqgA involved in biofilm formation
MTGTFINVGAVLGGTLIGVLVGHRLPEGIQQRVLMGLGMVTMVLGIQFALAWDGTNPIIVMGAVLLGGVAGELVGIERRLAQFGDALQRRFAGDGHSRISEGFVTASLLFCVGPLTVVGSIEDGLTGNYQVLEAKALLDGFASIAFAATLGWGVGLAAISVLLIQGGITLGASPLDGVLGKGSESLAALTSAGGILIIGIALKLLDLRDVRVGNYLPALLFAPCIVGLVSLWPS